jgi:hypothetical protein
MERPNLKIAKFTNPNQTFITERYVVENEEDLKLLLAEFPQLDNNAMGVAGNWQQALDEGRILLITDESWIGYPTYQFESPVGSTHPSCLIRVTLDT